MRIGTRWSLVGSLCLATACSAPTDANARVASVEIQLPPGADYLTGLTMYLGESRQLSAVARDLTGRVVEGARVEWSHANYSGRIAVTPEGVVTTEALGGAEVIACAGSVCDQAVITVRKQVVAMEFAVDSVRLQAGNEVIIGPVLRDSDGAAMVMYPDHTALGSSDEAVATIGRDWKLTAVGEGRAVINTAMDEVSVELPVRVTPPPTLVSVSHGDSFRCALSDAGDALCWGRNNNSQLGVITPRLCIGGFGQYCAQGESPLPIYVWGWLTFTELSSGYYHTCALTAEGEAFCWGSNFDGRLGSKASSYCSDLIHFRSGPCSAVPVRVEGGHRFATIAAGAEHTCALTATGSAYCWGIGGAGRLGDGGSANRTTPTEVSGQLAFRSISAGSGHTCAVTSANEAYCWGSNGWGVLGTGNTESSSVPVRAATSLAVAEISAGGNGTCALTTAGEVYCWGHESVLGTDTAPETCSSGSTSVGCSRQPIRVGLAGPAAAVSVSSSLACALDGEGDAHCWGAIGRLPSAVQGAPPLRSVSAGWNGRACGVSVDDVVYCWGVDRVASRVPGQR